MRILALSSLLVLGALTTPARADRKDLSKSPEQVATLAPRTEHLGASLATGKLGLTGSTRAARNDLFLSAAEVAAEVRRYAPDIEQCYLERLGDPRRAGHLDLTFVIGRDGHVVSVAAAAPALATRTAHQVESCIREAVEALRFPPRRNETTAIVPYYFQHTNAPGAGPQPSCWNPRGCRSS
jgi:hypothetical protein